MIWQVLGTSLPSKSISKQREHRRKHRTFPPSPHRTNNVTIVESCEICLAQGAQKCNNKGKRLNGEFLG